MASEVQYDESGLAIQDVDKLKSESLNPLTPEIISRQATINIGTIGHVAHGKSTVVRAISGVHVSIAISITVCLDSSPFGGQ